VEQGKIDLDKSVSTYIKAFTVSDNITVRHLLHHVSGMTEGAYNSWEALPPDAEFSDLVRDMNNMSLTNTPGEQFAYFNPNYSLLGYIIEIVSGQSYVEYMEENIVKPLGLKNTSLTGEVDTLGHLSFFGFSTKHNEKYVKYDLPGGFMTSTAEDLILFLDAIRMKDPIIGLSPEGFQKLILTYPSDNFYSMGWMNYRLADRPAIHHGGSLPGFSANAIMLPEDEYSIAILLNKNHLTNAYMFYPDLTNGIIGILNGQEPPTRFNYFWIYRLLIILFTLTIIANIRKFIKLIMKPDEKTIKWRIRSVIINLAIPLGLLLLLPLGGRFMFAQRGMKLSLVYLLMPDFITWLFVGISVHLIVAGIHLSFIIKNYCSPKNIES
jgi:CubicO group peptidase (beta-lactamase class C family)